MGQCTDRLKDKSKEKTCALKGVNRRDTEV